MSVVLTINGQTYDYPTTGDQEWGPEATDWASAVTVGMLQKAGGLFQLLAEVDFGSSFGLKSIYFKSRTTNPASAGQLRLASADTIAWRNNANNGNLLLAVDASDNLTYNGNQFGGALGVANTNSIDLTLIANEITADLNLSAAVATAGSILVNMSIQSDGLKGQWLLSAVPTASASLTGFLSSTDWSTFNNKQPAGSYQPSGNYITALTGDVTATGPGSVAAAIQPVAISGQTNDASPDIGTDSALTFDSSASGLKKVLLYLTSAFPVRTETNDYTATISDGVILMNISTSKTVTLPAASTVSRKIFNIKKIDSSLSNIVTIDANGSETIDGALTITLATQFESVVLYCDGSNWQILDRYVKSSWTAYTPTLGGGFGTTTGNAAVFRRNKDSIEVMGTFTVGTRSAVLASISLPSGLAIDSAKLSITNNTTSAPGNLVGQFIQEGASGYFTLVPAPGTSTSLVYIGRFLTGTPLLTPQLGDTGGLFSNVLSSYKFTVPIANWNG